MKDILDYIRVISGSAAGWILCLLGIIGQGIDMSILETSQHWWVWAGMAILGIIVAQYQAYKKLRIERDSYLPSASPDWMINDAVKYLLGNCEIGESSDPISDLYQAACDGRVTIWGRELINDGPPRSGAIGMIDKGFWRENEFESVLLIADSDSEDAFRYQRMTRRLRLSASEMIEYGDLHVNKSQVMSVWKPRRTNLRKLIGKCLAENT